MAGSSNTFTSLLPNYKQVYSDSDSKKKLKEAALKKLRDQKKKK